MASNVSRLDTIYRSLLLTRFFTKGWGKPEHLKKIFELRRRLANREIALSYVEPNYPVTITHQEIKSDHQILEGHFHTPFANYLPELLPPESEKAYFQVILPTKWKSENYRPVCVQYAGTGDHYFWRRRRLMALPMIRERGIGSIILENPFYGLRKPKHQLRSSLQQVSDLFVMGACLILESLVLFHWCDRQGFWPLVSHGISMGGHMASLGATVWPKPIALVPCLSWTSASVTFTKGVMTGAIPWHFLEKQYSTLSGYREEIIKMVQSEENAFKAGVEFAQNFEELSVSPPSAKSTNHENGQIFNPTKPTESNNSLLGSIQLPSFSYPSSLLSVRGGGLPFLTKFLRNDTNETTTEAIRKEAVQFMRGIMDECTHLKNFDIPYDPSLIYIVVAEKDAYQPREGVSALPDIWPGAKLRYIHDQGHVSSYLFKQDVFRQAIYDALDALVIKYGNKNNF